MRSSILLSFARGNPPKRLSACGLHAERVDGRDPLVLADLTRVNMALSGHCSNLKSMRLSCGACNTR
jgi:hypothetical protein